MLTGFRNVGARIAVAIGLVVFSCSSMAFDVGNLFSEANTKDFCERVQSTDVYKQYAKLTADAVNGGYYSAKDESDLFDTNDKKLRGWMRSKFPEMSENQTSRQISLKKGESGYLISDDAMQAVEQCAGSVLNTEFGYVFFRPDQLNSLRSATDFASSSKDYLFADSTGVARSFPHWLALLYGGEQTLNETGTEFLKAYESELLANKKTKEEKLAAQAASQAQAAKQAQEEEKVKVKTENSRHFFAATVFTAIILFILALAFFGRKRLQNRFRSVIEDKTNFEVIAKKSLTPLVISLCLLFASIYFVFSANDNDAVAGFIAALLFVIPTFIYIVDNGVDHLVYAPSQKAILVGQGPRPTWLTNLLFKNGRSHNKSTNMGTLQHTLYVQFFYNFLSFPFVFFKMLIPGKCAIALPLDSIKGVTMSDDYTHTIHYSKKGETLSTQTTEWFTILSTNGNFPMLIKGDARNFAMARISELANLS